MLLQLRHAWLCQWRFHTSRWVQLMMLGFIVGINLCGAIIALPDGKLKTALTVYLIVNNQIVITVVAILLKRQVVHAREYRLPNAWRPHLFLSVGLIFMFAFGALLARLMMGFPVSVNLFGLSSIVTA